MSRHRLLAAASALVILAGTGTLIARSGEDEGTAPAIGIPSSQFWAQRLYPSQTLSEEAREHEADAGLQAERDIAKHGHHDQAPRT